SRFHRRRARARASSERVRRVEETVSEAREEGEVVAQHAAPKSGEVVEEAASPRRPQVEVELQPFPEHDPRDRLAREMAGADVRHVAVVTIETVWIRHQALRQELVAHLGAGVRRETLHDREVETQAARIAERPADGRAIVVGVADDEPPDRLDAILLEETDRAGRLVLGLTAL